MKLKPITDPEEALLLWQAGLMVGGCGLPWWGYSKWCSEFKKTQPLDGVRMSIEQGDSYVIVEE